MDQDLDTIMGAEDEEPKSNTRTIIIVIAAVLLCCCCVIVVAGWFSMDYIIEFFQGLFDSYSSVILNITA